MLRLAALAMACLPVLPAWAQESIHIHMPAASGLHLYSPDAFTSLVSFSGEVALGGSVLLRSYRQTRDGESERRIELVFVPDPGEYGKFPVVRHLGETPDRDSMHIDLDHFDPAARKAGIAAVFGHAVADRIEHEDITLAQHGNAVVADYRTGVECDRRHHYARLKAFTQAAPIAAARLRKLTSARRDSCAVR